MDNGKTAFAIFGIIVFITIFCAVLALVNMWLWNYVAVSALTVAKPIDYWVALTSTLFGCGLFRFVSRKSE